MFEGIELFNLVRASTSHSARHNTIVARNIANADTPGFKAGDLQSFSDSYGRNLTPPIRATRTGHISHPAWSQGAAREFTSDNQPSPNGNSVSLEEEMFKLAQVKRQHGLSVGIYQSAMKLMRTSIDRRG